LLGSLLICLDNKLQNVEMAEAKKTKEKNKLKIKSMIILDTTMRNLSMVERV
jgi:hypothetical protein